MTTKRTKQIKALAADGKAPDEIVELLDVTIADVTAALTEQIEETVAEPMAGDARIEVWERHSKRKQSAEHIALLMGVSAARVEATLLAIRRDRDGRSRGPAAAAINAAADANEWLKRRLTGCARTADGDTVARRRPGETDSEQYIREKYGRRGGGRGVL